MQLRRSRARIAVVALLFTAACGSTAQVHSTLQGGGGGGQNGLGGSDGTSTSGSSLSTGGAGSSGGSGTSGTSAGSGTSGTSGSFGTTGSGTVGGSGSTGTTGSTSASSGRSSTTITGNDPVKIGYLYSSDQAAVAKQFGATGVVAGDTSAQYKAIAVDINKRGGVLGHQLKLIGYDISTANEINNASAEESKACTFFVQDQHVFAVLATGYLYLSPCLAKNGIPSLAGGGFDDPSTIKNQLIYDGGGMLNNVVAQAYISRLAAQNYFTGWDTTLGRPGPAKVRVGLIYPKQPLYESYYAEVKRQLKARGFTVDPSDEFVYDPNASGVASQSQAAVIKFSGDGVTHVFGAALLFYKAAANQSYHPRYGLDSIVPPALLASQVKADQLHGALGIGWRPTWDVNQTEDPGPVSPLATRCTDIMRNAGEDVSTRTVIFLSHSECEQLWSLASAFEKGGAVSLSALKTGFDALGSPTPVVSFGERWAPDRHASNTTVADLVYQDGCGCFTYTKTRTSF